MSPDGWKSNPCDGCTGKIEDETPIFEAEAPEELSMKEERADMEQATGRFKAFDSMKDLLSELRGHGAMRPCNNPSCVTCFCDCWWRRYD